MRHERQLSTIFMEALYIMKITEENKQKLFNYLYKDLNATFFYKRKYDRLLLNL